MKIKKRKSLIGVMLAIVAFGVTMGFQAQAECGGCRTDNRYTCCEGVWGDEDGNIFAYEIPGRKFLIKM